MGRYSTMLVFSYNVILWLRKYYINILKWALTIMYIIVTSPNNTSIKVKVNKSSNYFNLNLTRFYKAFSNKYKCLMS